MNIFFLFLLAIIKQLRKEKGTSWTPSKLSLFLRQATCAQIFAKQYLLSYNFNFTMKGSKSLSWVFLQHNLSFQFSSCQKSALNEAPFNCFISNVTSLCVTNFYRTQVYLGSDLWVQVSLTHSVMFGWLNWCVSGWWRYQLNSSWWYQ